jgi:NADPH-dependent 2,4-dienoyl-CoA reductase/sulfur reductase-like enzyme
VSVNEYMETSVGGIYAAGDIARWPDAVSGERIRVEHWVVAERQARSRPQHVGRADALPFRRRSSGASTMTCRSACGHAEEWDFIDIHGDVMKRDCVVRYKRGGQVLAVASSYHDKESLEAGVAMEHEAAKA